MARAPYQNPDWVGWYRDSRKSGSSHATAVIDADDTLNAARRARGDRRTADTDPTGIYSQGPERGRLKPGRGWTGRPIEIDPGDEAEAMDRGPMAGAIRQQTGGLAAMRKMRRSRGWQGSGAGAQAIAARRGSATVSAGGPGAQARATRRAERAEGVDSARSAVGAGLARVRAIGAALRARRAELRGRQDVADLADELAEAVDAGSLAAAEIPTVAADSGASGAELLAALAAAMQEDENADLADVLAAIAEAASGTASPSPSPVSDCACASPGDNMPTIAQILSAAGYDPQSGRTSRLALAARETAFRLSRNAGVAAGATVNVTVNTNKEIAPGSALYAVAYDPATGNQLFDFSLSALVIAGDNVYLGPLGFVDGISLNSEGQQTPGCLISRKIPSGTTITYSVTNNTAVAANILVELRCQATASVGNFDGTCSA